MTNQSSIAISKYVLINICAKFLFISQHVIRYVSQLIAEEFWTQGDIERQELNVEPQPMFDRSVALSTVQIGNGAFTYYVITLGGRGVCEMMALLNKPIV